MATKITLGTLILVILSASIYIMLPDQVRLDFEDTRTLFKTYDGSSWQLEGKEYVRVFDGTKKMLAKDRDVRYVIGTYDTTVIRTADMYRDDVFVKETYTFDNNVIDIKDVPISHEICFYNATGKIFEYLITDILYTGPTMDISSPFEFSDNMKVTFDEGYYRAKVYQQKSPDKIIVRYRIDSDYECFNVKLFDPPSTLVTDLKIFYDFENNFNDTSGNDYDGIAGDSWQMSQGAEGLGIGWEITDTHGTINTTFGRYTAMNASYTVSFMVNCTTIDDGDSFYFLGKGFTNYSQLNWATLSGKFIIERNTAAGAWTYNVENIALDEKLEAGWTHVLIQQGPGSQPSTAAWFDGVNQTLAQTSSGNPGNSKYPANHHVARFDSSGSPECLFDNWGFWNRTLTASEISSLNTSRGGLVPNLIEGTLDTLLLNGLASNRNIEINTPINITTNNTLSNAKVCLDINHSAYGTNYICADGNTSVVFNVSYFDKVTFNDSQTTQNLSYNLLDNNTFYINAHQWDEVFLIQFNLTGYKVNNTYPENVNIYINHTLSNDLGPIRDTTFLNLSILNNSLTKYNVTFNQLIGNFNVTYLKIQKTARVTASTIVLRGYNFTVEAAETETKVDDFSDSDFNTSLWANITQNTVLSETDGYILLRSGTGVAGIDNVSILWLNNTDIPDLTTNNITISRINFDASRNLFPSAAGTCIKIFDNASISAMLADPSTQMSLQGVFIMGLCDVPSVLGTYSKTYTDLVFSYDGTTEEVIVKNGTGINRYDVSSLNNSQRLIPIFWVMSRGSGAQGNMKVYDYNYTTQGNVTSYSTNPYLEIGTIGGNREFNYTGTFETVEYNVTDFNGSINNFLDTCTADVNNYCYPPLTFYSESQGQIEISDIRINYTYEWNPITLSINLTQAFLQNNTNFSNIPITIENNDNNGTITVSDLNFRYAGGNSTIKVLAHTTNYISNLTYNITSFYSRWDYNLPKHVDYIEFIPPTSTSKNVEPYGQIDTRGLFNMSYKNYGNRNMNLSIYLNETFSCVNLTISTTNNKSDGIKLLAMNWTNVTENKPFLYNHSIWIWADYSCTYSQWKLWYPDFYIRGCCNGCICSGEV